MLYRDVSINCEPRNYVTCIKSTGLKGEKYTQKIYKTHTSIQWHEWPCLQWEASFRKKKKELAQLYL